MNDIEMRKSILQYAYDHRFEHQLQIVGIEDMPFLKEQKKIRITQNIKFLRDQELIKTWDDPRTLISVTTPGITLIEDQTEFDRRFPIRFDLPEQTKKLIDTVEEMLTPKNPDVLNQFKKARNFLYDDQPPDYLNSVKEAVGAVEGLAKAICNRPKETLSDLLPEMRQKHLSHPAMGKIIEAIYAVRSDEPGIGHGAHSSSSFEYADAEFMLNFSASIIIYLLRKEAQE